MGYRKVKFRHHDSLANMPWDEFERLVGEHYASRGYRVEHSGTGASGTHRRYDGGIDLKLYRGDEYIVVQCKRENVFQVTHNVVHELIGVMHTQGATGAIVVNAGEYSVAAREAAAKFPQIELIDGLALRRMLAATGHMPVDTWTNDVLASMTAATVGYRRRKPPSWMTPRHAITILVAKCVLGVGVPMLMAYVVVPHILKNTSDALIQQTQRAAVPHPTVPSQTSQTFAKAPRLNAVQPYQAPGSINEPSAPPTLTKLSKKESAEWDRKNAESMRILEKTTPSLD